MSAKRAADGSAISRMGRGMLLLMVGVGCGAAVAVAPDIVAAALVLQLPGLVGWLLDPTPGRAVAKTVLLFQAAASVRPIASIWFQCDGLNACVAMATDRHTFLVVMLAAVAGFGLTQILPLVVKSLSDSRLAVKRERLIEERQKIAAEWQLDL